MYSSGTTLKTFLIWRLTCLVLCVALLLGLAIHLVYWWGLDDSSEYYLFKDAEWAVHWYQSRGELPESNEFRQYFMSLNELPDIYRNKLKEPLLDYHYEVIETQSAAVYLLAYPMIDGESQRLYVAHHFPQDDDPVAGMTLFELAVIVSLAVFGLALLVAALINSKIIEAVGELLVWANGDKRDKPQLRFAELQQVAGQLYESIAASNEQIQQEAEFVRSLAHELRTPLAIVSAALDILETKTLENDIASKVDKIRQATNAMSATSDTLLRVWMEDDQLEPRRPVKVRDLVAQILAEQQEAMQNEQAVELSIAENVQPLLPQQSFRIVAANLLQNALRHGSSGIVLIRAEQDFFEISNAVNSDSNQDQSTTGYGVGQFIVAKIAAQYGWHFETVVGESRYQARIYW